MENHVLSPRGDRRAQVIETHIAPGGSPGPSVAHSGDLIIATVLQGGVEFRFEERTPCSTPATPTPDSPAEPHRWGNPDEEVPAVALFFEVPRSTETQGDPEPRGGMGAAGGDLRER